jgi:Aspartate decarboxylase
VYTTRIVEDGSDNNPDHEADRYVLADHEIETPVTWRRMNAMRLRTVCKSKIHHAIVTQADLNYVGRIANR